MMQSENMRANLIFVNERVHANADLITGCTCEALGVIMFPLFDH